MKHTCVDTLQFKALSPTKVLLELFVFCFYIELFVIENRSGNYTYYYSDLIACTLQALTFQNPEICHINYVCFQCFSSHSSIHLRLLGGLMPVPASKSCFQRLFFLHILFIMPCYSTPVFARPIDVVQCADISSGFLSTSVFTSNRISEGICRYSP
jgi:hypothetical protein